MLATLADFERAPRILRLNVAGQPVNQITVIALDRADILHQGIGIFFVETLAALQAFLENRFGVAAASDAVQCARRGAGNDSQGLIDAGRLLASRLTSREKRR